MKLYNNIVYDSRKAVHGSLFVCLRGALADGHKFAKNAYDNGCRAFMCEEKLNLPEDAVQIIKADTRIALAEASAEFFGFPAHSLKLIGVTGTKGKTSVATFTGAALNKAGKHTAFIGTTGIVIDGERTPTLNSTPESFELHKAFAEMVKRGVEYVVMEVSSQAYKTHRVHGLEFEVGVFTNLSPDHLGGHEHPNFDDYRYCKSQLFKHSKISILNMDDDNFGFMADSASGVIKTVSLRADADYNAKDVEMWQHEGKLGVSFSCEKYVVSVNTPGEYTVYNALTAFAICDTLEAEMDKVVASLAEVSVKGRFEVVEALPYATFIIDYAHNEVSLRNVLRTLKSYNPSRLICLFGAVGHTVLRRAALAEAANEYADYCIITSDNPEYENPLDIIADIKRAIRIPYIAITDRTDAVRYAVENAENGDMILFAGKGHEDYQLVKGIHVPFNERAIIEETAAAILAYH